MLIKVVHAYCENRALIIREASPASTPIPLLPSPASEATWLTYQLVLPQTQLARLQKERESAASEVETLTEKVDLLQAQLGKAQRDRENALGDMELLKEKYEKTSAQTQKLMVGDACWRNLTASTPTRAEGLGEGRG